MLDVALGSSQSMEKLSGEMPNVVVFSDLGQAMDTMSPLVTTHAITAQAGELVMLHACAVSDPATGRTLALVGPSGAGKTTAVRVLARTFGYVTDETVGILPDLSVVPYPKPLSVLAEAAPVKTQVSPDAAGLLSPVAPLQLVGVLVLARDGAGAAASLEAIPTLEALAEVGTQTSYLARLDRPLQRLAHVLTANLPPQRVRYQEAEQLVAITSMLLRRAG